MHAEPHFHTSCHYYFFCSKPFTFKIKIEKEGLPRDLTPALGRRSAIEGAKDGPVRFVGPPDWPVFPAKHQDPIDWGPFGVQKGSFLG
jgi:hypothetical protein